LHRKTAPFLARTKNRQYSTYKSNNFTSNFPDIPNITNIPNISTVTIIWNPQDESCIACKVKIHREAKRKTWEMNGRIFTVEKIFP